MMKMKIIINKLIKYFKVPRHLSLAIIFISVSALITVYISQYVFGLKPCHLCLYQRVPYGLNIVFGLAAFMASYRYPRLVTLLLILSGLMFFIGASIALFHTGVEQGWWDFISACMGNKIPEHASFEEFKAMITSTEIIRCDKPAWTLFGISMAGYNFIASTYFGLITTYLLIMPNNNK